MELNLYNPSVININVADSVKERFQNTFPKIVMIHRAKFTNRLRKLEFSKEDITITPGNGFTKYTIKVESSIQREKWIGFWTLFFAYVEDSSADITRPNSDFTLEFPCNIFYKHPILSECDPTFPTQIDLYVILNDEGGYSIVNPFKLDVSKLDSGDFLDWGVAEVFILDKSQLNTYDYLE